jgi:hypothetical protein
MKEGLLWYDGEPGRDLAERVARAARRYRQKFGAAANVCYVHPSAINGGVQQADVDGIHIEPMLSVLRHHFWVGRVDGHAEH